MRAALAFTVVGLLATAGAMRSARPQLGPRRRCARSAVVTAAVAPAEDEDRAMADALLDAVEEWVREQRVAEIVPEKKLRSLLAAVRADVSFWERQHIQYERLWHRLEAQLRLDARPVREVLGAELSHDLADMVETYDSTPLVRGMMGSQVVERLLGSVLYEALFAFIQSVDILGQMMSSLPFFGPMREQIIAQSKRQLDTVLGEQISGFLGSYTKVAVKSAVAYVDEHPADFGRAQRRLAEGILDRPFNEVLPSPADLVLVRDSLWLRLRNLRPPNEDEIIEELYAEFGDETIDTLLPLNNPRVEPRHAPRIYLGGRDLLAGNLHAFIASEQGRRCMRQLRELGAHDGAHGGAPPARAAAPAPAPAAAAPADPAEPERARSAAGAEPREEEDDASSSALDDWD